MKILVVHQNMPGQFRHLITALASDPRNSVVFATKRQDIQFPNVKRISYTLPRAANATTHHYLRACENAVLHGQTVARVAMSLKRA